MSSDLEASKIPRVPYRHSKFGVKYEAEQTKLLLDEIEMGRESL